MLFHLLVFQIGCNIMWNIFFLGQFWIHDKGITLAWILGKLIFYSDHTFYIYWFFNNNLSAILKKLEKVKFFFCKHI